MRRKHLADLVRMQKRLADHGELLRQADAVVARNLEEHQHRAPDLRRLERHLVVQREELGDAALEPFSVGLLAAFADLQQHFRRVVGMVVAHRKKEPQQPLLKPGGDARHHAEVDERDAPVDDEHIARMRIGMEHAIAQYLLEIGAEQRVGQALAVELAALDARELGDLGPGMNSIASTRALV